MTESEMLDLYNKQKSDSQFPPCYNRQTGERCKERYLGCHAECKRYLEYRAYQDRRLEKQHKETLANMALGESFDRCKKIHDRRKRK